MQLVTSCSTKLIVWLFVNGLMTIFAIQCNFHFSNRIKVYRYFDLYYNIHGIHNTMHITMDSLESEKKNKQIKH